MLNFKDIKENEYVSFTQYLKVKSKGKDSIIVENHLGATLEIDGVDLIETLDSAGQYKETIKVSKHEMVDKLQGAKDKVFTIKFQKTDGSDRVLTGHLHGIEGNLGRTSVIDLEIPVDDKTRGLRLIDNRQIEWLVLDGVMYIDQ
jgi:hypothetical protein